MKRILLTGATGNIGVEIQKHFPLSNENKLLLASRQPLAENERFFDFEKPEASKNAIEEADVLFLLRPPHIADVNKYFAPLIHMCKECGVQHIVVLSVQGADKISFIPHAKIEKLILQSGINYTFVRPSYFMQNLTTAFREDIKLWSRIEVPAGKAKFLWIDGGDIGLAIAKILSNTAEHINKSYTLTGKDLLDFHEASQLLSKVLNRTITYRSPNLLAYYLRQKKAGLNSGSVMATMLIHFLQRFQQVPSPTNDLAMLTGKEPVSLVEFAERNKSVWQ